MGLVELERRAGALESARRPAPGYKESAAESRGSLKSREPPGVSQA